MDEVHAVATAASAEAESVNAKKSDQQAPSPQIGPRLLEPNLRRLRACLAVYEFGGVHKAAEKLHLTQSSLTRAVQEMERELGVRLFERTPRGMISNDFGAILIERTRRALEHLDAAEKELLAVRQDAVALQRLPGFCGKVTHRQLYALIGIFDFQTETCAAKELALSQPALTLALRDLERLVGAPLFLRTARGMIATESGEILSRRAKLAFSEIRAVNSDIAARVGVITGRVVIGMLPLSGPLLAPRAINRLLHEHPSLQVTVVDANYQSLIQGLLCGDIDVVVGGLDYRTPKEISQEHLFQDWLSIVARRGHPLAAKKSLSLSDLAGAAWVVPRIGTPARICFNQVMATAGLELGINPIVANVSPVRALLMESDRIAVMSRHQIHFEESSGLLTVLPITLHGTNLPIGIRTRADASPSVGVKALIRHLRSVSADMLKFST